MYREWSTSVPGAVLWHTPGGRGPIRRRILPDGCMDLIWDGKGFFIAGPDSAARMHEVPDGVGYVGLRLSGGLGPALLGLPADELRDERPDLDAVWRPNDVQELGERTAGDPIQALTDWVVERTARTDPDPLGPAILTLATRGHSPAESADRLGLTARTLHRSALRLFGYGPRHLSRIMRFGAALAAARSGHGLADVAAEHGYADQAHLSREAKALGGATMTTLLREQGVPQAEGANRSTGLPSGSRTTA